MKTGLFWTPCLCVSVCMYRILLCVPFLYIAFAVTLKCRVHVYVMKLQVGYRLHFWRSLNSLPCRWAHQIPCETHCSTFQQLSCCGFESNRNSFVSCTSYLEGNWRLRLYTPFQKHGARNIIMLQNFPQYYSKILVSFSPSIPLHSLSAYSF